MKTKIALNFIVLLTFLAGVANAQSISYSATGNADFLIVDPQGRKSGIDGIAKIEYDQIPSALIGSAAYGDQTPEDENSVDANIEPAINGDYQFIIYGDSLSQGYVNPIVHYSDNGPVSNIVNYSIIDSGMVVTIKLHFVDNDRQNTSLTKIIDQNYFLKEINAQRKANWILNDGTKNAYISFVNNYFNQITAGNVTSASATLASFRRQLVSDSSSLSINGYSIRDLSQDITQLQEQLPLPPSGLNVKLVNSMGVKLIGGSLQYYDGSWKLAVNNNDGTFTINTTLKNVSLQVTYAYGVQTKSNVTVGSDTVVFQTVNAQVKLQNSQGNLIDTGAVQYYAGAWRNFGTTTSGVATMELLPINYSFSMTYAYASNNKAQDLSANPIVVFQTTNTSVQLKNSQGNLMDTGTVQYYSGAWRTFGTTSGGVTTKELLPNSYSFSMTYAYASNNKQQDIGANSTVVFQTVNAVVQLKNSQGNLIDQGTVQYYSGAWRTFGATSGGVTSKELLPNSYSFMMNYAYASNTKQQDLNSNPTVVFQTVNTTVQLKNSQGSLMDAGTVQYYSGAWRTFGTTTNGAVSLELLPNSYQFSMTYAYVSNNKTQDVGSNNTVIFSTVLATVNVINTQNNPVNNAVVTYYSGAWRQFGNTVNGNATKELLPASLQFRAQSGSVSQNKTQDLSANPVVVITLNQ